jgi:SPP1 family predicted phage head-tail adaptor
MQIGDFDRRIKIQGYSEVTDGYGQMLPVWSTLTDAWAKVAYEDSTEMDEADQLVAVSVVKFFVRLRKDIDETMRVKWDGMYYAITSIEEINPKYMVIRTEYKDSKWFDVLRSTGTGVRETGEGQLRATEHL